jgi:hypothetical protein
MKKRSIITIAVLVIIGIGATFIITNQQPLKLDSDNISYIVIRNGTTGQGMTLETDEEIVELVAQFNELRLVKGKRLEPFSGFTISLSVYSKRNPNKSDGYIVLSYGMIHKNHLYNISNVDTEIELYEHLLSMYD